MIDQAHLQTETLSPYLPGTNIQYAWDSTSIGYAKTCPRLYQLTMIEGWTTKDESIHLRFGIEFHKIDEDYQRFRAEGQGHQEATENAVHQLLIRIADWDPDITTRAGKYKNTHSILQLGIDFLDKYNSEGASDPAETLILANGKPAVELSFRFELDFGPQHSEITNIGCTQSHQRQPYILSGHLDRVASYNGVYLVLDKKTSLSTISNHYFTQYDMSPQMTLYTLAGKVVLETPIKGVCIDAAQVKLDEPNHFARGFTYRTPAQLEEWLTDLRVLFQTFETYAIANYWPMNDTACDKFGGCRFRPICSRDPAVRDRMLKSDYIKLAPEDRWNPLKPR